jgi:hypothetical protein
MGYDPQSETQETPGSGTTEPTATQTTGAESNPTASPSLPGKDSAPDCPACGWGFLYAIAKTESGTLYHCFHCERSLSILDDNPKQQLAVQGVDAPTAAAPTHQQLQAQKDAVEGHPAEAFHKDSTPGGAN